MRPLIKEALLNSEEICTDATGIKMNGKPGYIRNFSTKDYVLYSGSEKKNIKTLKNFRILREFSGTLIPAGYIEWLNDRMYQSDSYDRIEEWLTNSGIEFHDCCAACDTLLADIFFTIAYPNATDTSEVKLPDKNTADGDISFQLSENDKDLLKNFHIDFDSILEKCIASNQAEVWFTGSLSTKVNGLYNEKWKDQIAKFEDIGLQSDILSTIATLQDFCKALDPDSYCKFSTIASFLKYGYGDPEYDLLVIDECSTVSNSDMRKLLEMVKFKKILLVGDTYQINSIRFGNWFTALRSFLPPTSVFELTKPYRTKSQRLLILWSKVRAMDDNVQEIIDKQNCSLKVDEALLTAARDDEAVLCLNYDGLYGISNINRFLQESNPNPAVEWDVQQYKVGDPILFLENNRFHPVIYNNMRGKIVGIEKLDLDTPNERIQFDIELNTQIDPADTRFMPLDILDNPDGENTIVRFSVYKVKSTDDDDDGNTARTIVPFQIAYAVSIHKAQGLEYSSVKIVITDEVDELITHNIFYTAITRAQNELKIYFRNLSGSNAIPLTEKMEDLCQKSLPLTWTPLPCSIYAKKINALQKLLVWSDL